MARPNLSCGGRRSRPARGAVLAIAVAALAAAGCAATHANVGSDDSGAPPANAARPGPPEPIDVRVTDLPSDLVDAIADRIADRVVARLDERAAAAGAPNVPSARRPRGVPAPAAALKVATRDAGVSRAGPFTPPPPAPPATEGDVLAVREATKAGLDWLARHQGEDGLWSASRNGGEASYDVGVSGLAVLAFLGAGETMDSGPHAENVKLGLKRLLEHQDAEGCVGPRSSSHFMYNHAYAALALTEGLAATRSPVLRVPAQRAVDFILRARNPYLGWRYGIRDGDNDTSMTGLMVMVLRSAKTAGLDVDDAAFSGALSWFDKMTDPEYGRTGYQQRGGPSPRTIETVSKFPADRVESTTAVATAARIFAGADAAGDEWVKRGADVVAAKPPVWSESAGSIDFHYWYWGTLAMSRKGGSHWASWRNHMIRALPSHQRGEPAADERGSWDPVDAWSSEGGRVYTTAMGCLISEIVGRTGN